MPQLSARVGPRARSRQARLLPARPLHESAKRRCEACKLYRQQSRTRATRGSGSPRRTANRHGGSRCANAPAPTACRYDRRTAQVVCRGCRPRTAVRSGYARARFGAPAFVFGVRRGRGRIARSRGRCGFRKYCCCVCWRNARRGVSAAGPATQQRHADDAIERRHALRNGHLCAIHRRAKV